ncbi:MAG TPA: YhfC family glutamic-type intramembrane protease [Ktedonobacteraceae bacterium]|jgi:uncharacterized membrane protein YhfC
MPSTLHVSATWLTIMIVSTIIVIVCPFIFGIVARRRLAVGWKYFWFGALVFLVFQLLTRIPLVVVLQSTVLAPLLRASTAFAWIWLTLLALTAGLFEEVGRYLGYRLFMGREPKTWAKAVMFGLGHEGLESLVLVGGVQLLTLLSLALFGAVNVNDLPADQRQAVSQLFVTINAQPGWFPLLSAWERLWSFPLQVMLSVIVLQVFLRHDLRWLFLAILLHALIDFLVLALPQAAGSSIATTLMVEGIVCLAGLFGIWVIWRLHQLGEQPGMGGPEGQAAGEGL